MIDDIIKSLNVDKKTWLDNVYFDGHKVGITDINTGKSLEIDPYGPLNSNDAKIVVFRQDGSANVLEISELRGYITDRDDVVKWQNIAPLQGFNIYKD